MKQLVTVLARKFLDNKAAGAGRDDTLVNRLWRLVHNAGERPCQRFILLPGKITRQFQPRRSRCSLDIIRTQHAR